ncbi:TPA: colicin immunity protein Cui [Enterobacter cloacae]|uniref:colicin immunity protein Cui n=1 Tax=Enterobacter cloacae TaxID=550 RepID=UPI000578F956|nr:colicin immunity protein Cui [Enterobacter cloacae]HCM9136715.1 colicin immunity protein Cui [Enterobacter cloacae subsp. cloacae]HCT8368658.1 colicin immunity protein Cui [Enterobacter cloacae]HDC4761831.1 colicin immunity protein Cui [Enterobacter cloacae]HDT6533573.1 colicin immunity protein Cui [Enterobacter cloacae]
MMKEGSPQIKDKIMRRSANRKKPGNSVMTKIVVTIWFITVIPFIMMFVIYSENPFSPSLNYLAEVTRGLPVLHSANNPLLSSVMSAWCKTAPFWGGIAFIFSYKYTEVNGAHTTGHMLKGLALFSALYLPITYMLLIHSAEMTESGKLYRFMSQNDYLLVTLFVTIYSVCYTYTAYYLVIIAATIKTFFWRRNTSL